MLAGAAVVLAVAVLGVYRAAGASRPVAGALWLLAISLKPQLMPPLLVFLAMRRCYRLLGYAAAMFLVSAIVTSAILGPMIWIDYVRHVGQLEAFFGTGTPEYMMNVRGVMSRDAALLGAQTIDRMAFGLWIASAIGLAAALWHWRVHERDDVRAPYALAVATTLLCGPHLFVQDAVIWAVPLAFLVPEFATFAVMVPLVFAVAHAAGSFDLQFVVLFAVAIRTFGDFHSVRGVRLQADLAKSG